MYPLLAEFAPPAPAPAPAAAAPAPAPDLPPAGTRPAALPGATTSEPQGVPVGTLLSVGQGPKRTNVACTRCRRGKVKCVTVDGGLPCQACIARGQAEGCMRGERGRGGEDRAPRARKRPVDDLEGTPSASTSSAARRPSFTPAQSGSGSRLAGSRSPPSPSWSPQAVQAPLAPAAHVKREEATGNVMLPPLPLLIEGCESFFEGYFQLGFLHRPSFLHRLRTLPDSIPPFLLLAMLAHSARFVPSLVAKHGSPTQASAVFAARAHEMVTAELVEPTLERVQALYLLGSYDYGHGCAFRCKMFQTLARNMADALALHKELLGASVLENEVRRRTWWFLTMTSDLLNAVAPASSSFDPLTVPVPLPSHEQDFTFGVESRVIQYFPGATSPAAKEHPTVPGEMSLLGALLAVTAIFGRTARVLFNGSSEQSAVPPWQPDSLLLTTQLALQSWLEGLSPLQQWSTANLLAYRTSNLDLGYSSIFVSFHTINLLLRRAYLPQMICALAPSRRDDPSVCAVAGFVPPEGRAYWASMAEQIVSHAFDLIELQEEVAGGRPITKGITAHLSCCIYLAGTILNYLRIYPWLCPARAPAAPARIATTLEMLQSIATLWPLADRCHRSLYAQATTPALASPGDPCSPASIARADLRFETEARAYPQFTPAGAAAEEASPAAEGKMDAASALAAMSVAAVPPCTAEAAHGWTAGQLAGDEADAAVATAAAAARHSFAVAGMLRPPAAPASEPPVDPPAVGRSTASGLFTPQPDESGHAQQLGGDALDEMLDLNFGDLNELCAFFGGYGGGLDAVGRMGGS